MQWSDEGYLLLKNNFDENSIIIDIFTLNHGRCSGIVYGGSSRKQKKIFQIGNKIYVNWKSKGENKSGYFTVELIKAISPPFFDDKKRSACILSFTSILKILLPERQTNKKIFNSLESMINNLSLDNWILTYVEWEFSLIKELGYEINISSINKNNIININTKSLKIPKFFQKNENTNIETKDIHDALIFNKALLEETFINPNRLRFPLFRNILESYYK